jgi:hypothetical protein
MIYRRSEGDVLAVHINQDLRKTSGEKVKTQDRSSCYEGEEVTVVATTDTIVDPHTVMILRLDAVIADSTVVTSWWTPDIASLAILYGHLHGSSR